MERRGRQPIAASALATRPSSPSVIRIASSDAFGPKTDGSASIRFARRLEKVDGAYPSGLVLNQIAGRERFRTVGPVRKLCGRLFKLPKRPSRGAQIPCRHPTSPQHG